MDIIDTIITQAFHEQSGWEILAVVLGLAYLVLAIKQNIWCWPCAFVSTVIYTQLFWHVSLLMDAMLNVYYILMAVYGFWVWRSRSSACQIDGKIKSNDMIKPIIRWSKKTHVLVIGGVVILSVASGLLLDRFTQAAWPFLVSFTTWGSVVMTYMVAKKVLENWIYWLVIDAIAMMLYIDRGLYFTALLFAVYLVMVIIGFNQWLKEYRNIIYT